MVNSKIEKNDFKLLLNSLKKMKNFKNELKYIKNNNKSNNSVINNLMKKCKHR